jgi:HYDIN/CFA65/VesB family protein/BACON domain-containing protein
MGVASKWIIVAIAALVVIATSSILLSHAFVPPSPPGLTITGTNVVRDGGILQVHGQGFSPGGSITLTIDNGLSVSLAGQHGTPKISQGKERSVNVPGLSQGFIFGALQPRSGTESNITVGSSGTFDANITVPQNLPAGEHTIHATENQGSQSASLHFSVPSSELTVNPSALNFGSLEVGRTVSLSVTLSNQGGTSLRWTATVEGSNMNWLTLPNSTGVIVTNGSDVTVTLTANTNGLSVGTQSATLRIHADNGDVPIPVSLNVIPHAQGAQQAIVNVPQQKLDFGQLQAGQQVQQSISIANLGSLPLKWQASSNTASATWLSLALTNGTVQPGAVPQTVQVNVNTTGLAAGSFAGTINITSNGGNATVTVNFTLTAVTPTPSPSPSLSPSPSQTLPPTWTVSPANLDVTTCSGSATWTCTVTLAEDASSQVGINWSSSSDQSSVIFSPASGMLSPGQSIPVTISSIPCGHANFTFTGSGGVQPVTALWNCTPRQPPPPPSQTLVPQITVVPLKMDQTSSNCSPNSDGTYNCSVTVSETSPGNLTWFAPTSIGGTGVSFNPPNGQLTASQAQQQVTISSIPCSSASFTFTDQNNNTASAVWSCTPTPTPPAFGSGIWRDPFGGSSYVGDAVRMQLTVQGNTFSGTLTGDSTTVHGQDGSLSLFSSVDQQQLNFVIRDYGNQTGIFLVFTNDSQFEGAFANSKYYGVVLQNGDIQGFWYFPNTSQDAGSIHMQKVS